MIYSHSRTEKEPRSYLNEPKILSKITIHSPILGETGIDCSTTVSQATRDEIVTNLNQALGGGWFSVAPTDPEGQATAFIVFTSSAITVESLEKAVFSQDDSGKVNSLTFYNTAAAKYLDLSTKRDSMLSQSATLNGFNTAQSLNLGDRDHLNAFIIAQYQSLLLVDAIEKGLIDLFVSVDDRNRVISRLLGYGTDIDVNWNNMSIDINPAFWKNFGKISRFSFIRCEN
jgi:hypothetical protein